MQESKNARRRVLGIRIPRSALQRGAAFMSILIVSTVIAIILSSLMTLLRTQQNQSNTIALRQIADQLNISARDLTVILWEKDLLQNCIVGQTVGGQDVNGVGRKDTPIGNLDVGTANPYRPPVLTFNFCTDLSNETEAECFQEGSPLVNRVTEVEFRLEEHTDEPALSEERYTWLLHITTYLKNRNTSKVFKHSADFHTSMKLRIAGFVPEACLH